MTKAVSSLLALSGAILALSENEEIAVASEALLSLGDGAKVSTDEYKKLKELIDGVDEELKDEAEMKLKNEADEAEMKITTYINGTLRKAGEVVYGDDAKVAKKAKVAK